MTLKKPPFRSYTLDKDKEEDREIISISISKAEKELLEEAKLIINQKKDSTAIKQLMKIGAKVIQSKKTKAILSIILGNKRRNKRLGIADFD